MTDANRKAFLYKTGTSEASAAILAVRIIVGLPIGLVAGFVGNIFNSIAVPSPVPGDISAFLARMAVIGAFAATGAMIAWFNLFESKRGALLVWSVAVVGGVLGALAAYYIGDRYIDHPDVYILNQRLSQAVLFGAALGANVMSTVLAIATSRLAR
ncbi:MAG: hypothetical protein IIC28_00925 [Chloroflexi bacterium]|nr:hypothetical protein [Chloroflexota bacterium]MCI0775204.1 hypothetical protein [Chloroflexota bacterium]MCI0805162.1 hypothetical protein [Chloroflexota bacterium]MCI0809046.1 hypothetical protein [Chloroflexota bacterium]MCI0834778.1 hypothetical protein [Chloroflexota bacterium]